MKAGSITTSVSKRRNHRTERGGSFTEAVVITPCFVIVVLMSIQFMVISFRAVTLQWITTVVMRDIALWDDYSTGSPPPKKSEDPAKVLQSAQERANSLAASIGIKLDQTDNAFCLSNITTSGICIRTWSPGDTLELKLRYNIPLFFSRLLFVNIPTQTVTGTATAVVENLAQRN